MSNYRAVAGPRSTDSGFFESDFDFGGILMHNSQIRFQDVHDGTSNTLIVGECVFDEAADKNGAIWAGMSGRRPNNSIWISDVMWWINEDDFTVNGEGRQAFTSQHPGGAQFSFCDGSTRLFPEAVEFSVMRFLAGRDDGVLTNNDF